MSRNPKDGSVYYELKTGAFYSEYDNDDELNKSNGEIQLISDNGKKEVIGKFTYYFMDMIPMDLFEKLDQESQYLYEMATDMFKSNQIDYRKDFAFMESVNSLILIDTIEIDEDYRGMGLLKGLIRFFRSYYESADILLKAYPMQFNKKGEYTAKEFNFALGKVIGAYEKCGFKRVNKKSSYMLNEGGTRIPN